MVAGVKLYGGFAGDETSLDERDTYTNTHGVAQIKQMKNKTILSGNLNVNDPTITDSVYHVVIFAGEMVSGSDTARLDGFTVTGGNADGYYYDLSVNSVDIYPGNGGGIYIGNVDSPVIVNDSIAGNKVYEIGGGVSIHGNGTDTKPSFSSTIISGNSAYVGGGGIYNYNSSSTFTNILVSENSTNHNYGGGIFDEGSSSTFTNMTVSGNSAQFGGGISNHSSSTFTNILVIGNSASSYGGGIDNDNSNSTYTNILVSGNSASDDGGGIFSYNYNSISTFINVTIAGNYSSSYNGGLHNINDPNGSFKLYNTIVWGNSNPNASIGHAPTEIKNSLIEGFTVNDDGNNNLDGSINPLFVDLVAATSETATTGGDYRLQFGSPVIGKGDNSYNSVPVDLSGNPRIVGFKIDLGAHEYPVAAENDTVIINISTPVIIDVLSNDDRGMYAGIPPTLFDTIPDGGPKHGTLTIEFATDSSFVYTPAAGYSGVDSIDYVIEYGDASSRSRVYILTIEPVASQYVACEGAKVTVGFKAISGAQYAWYDDAGDVIADSINSTMEIRKSSADTDVFYAEITYNGIRFPKRKVEVLLVPAATAADIEGDGGGVECYGNKATLTVSSNIASAEFRWYASQTSTEVLFIGSPFHTPIITADTAYYVSVSGTGYCENATGSRKRISITLQSNAGSAFVDDIWYFGANHQGIRFTKDSDGVYTAVSASNESKVNSRENSLVASSPYCDGQDIFYASHNELFNSLHEKMGDFKGNSSVADGLAACYMGANKYLLFSVTGANENSGGVKGLKAYVIDMNADHGRGAIIDSTEVVNATNNKMSESIELVADEAAPHKYWLIYAYDHNLHVREVDVNNYSSSDAGSVDSIVSDIDDKTIALSTAGTTYTLKASPQHNHVAIANADAETVDVFDFDNATGMLSNLRTTTPHSVDGIAYGVEFSPDGNQLYAAGYTKAGGTPKLCQYTITQDELVHVDDIVYWTYDSNDGRARGGGLKLGPDGKIYVILDYDTHVGAVSEPDNTTPLGDGTNGRYKIDALSLDLNIAEGLHYTLQFSTGLTRPSEMACNTNAAPIAEADSAMWCLSNISHRLRTTKVNVLANDTDEDVIYLTGAEFVHVSDTLLATIAVNPADSTISLTIKPDMSLDDKNHVFEIVYHVKDNGTPASQCATGSLKITAYLTPTYPDIRIRVCPDAGTTINLSKYLDTISGISSAVDWTSLIPAGMPVNSSTGEIAASNLLASGMYTFAYTINSSCVRIVYLDILRNGKMRPMRDTVEICYLHAGAIQLNQIFGIEAGGDISYPAEIASYIKTTSHGGTIMDGKAIYEDIDISLSEYHGKSAKKISFSYDSGEHSCLEEESYPITIVLIEN
jgi:hypothetical protein